MPESHKILPKIQQYLTGSVLEIGCGDECVVPHAFGIDGREFPCVDYLTDNLYGLPEQIPEHLGKYDCVFSSHVLEHLPDAYSCVLEWSEFCKQGGYFILYLPDGDYYNNEENREHFHDTKYEPFMMWFRRAFCGEGLNFKGHQYGHPIFDLVESGQDVKEDNHYSFYLVAKKL